MKEVEDVKVVESAWCGETSGQPQGFDQECRMGMEIYTILENSRVALRLFGQ
jgi:hypothetical protein